MKENQKQKPKYLHIEATSDDKKAVDIKLPLGILCLAKSLVKFIPQNLLTELNHELTKQGMNFDLQKLNSKKISEWLEDLQHTKIKAQDPTQELKIYFS